MINEKKFIQLNTIEETGLVIRKWFYGASTASLQHKVDTLEKIDASLFSM